MMHPLRREDTLDGADVRVSAWTSDPDDQDIDSYASGRDQTTKRLFQAARPPIRALSEVR